MFQLVQHVHSQFLMKILYTLLTLFFYSYKWIANVLELLVRSSWECSDNVYYNLINDISVAIARVSLKSGNWTGWMRFSSLLLVRQNTAAIGFLVCGVCRMRTRYIFCIRLDSVLFGCIQTQLKTGKQFLWNGYWLLIVLLNSRGLVLSSRTCRWWLQIEHNILLILYLKNKSWFAWWVLCELRECGMYHCSFFKSYHLFIGEIYT